MTARVTCEACGREVVKRGMFLHRTQPVHWQAVERLGYDPSVRGQRRPWRADEEWVAGFWARVDQSGGPDACWPWMGSRQSDGYGFTIRRGRRMMASRAALQFKIGRSLERDEMACHKCDNPPCCNPGHLFPGTASDNARDAVAKGRVKRVLTEADVVTIKRIGGPAADLAARFGVSVAHIRSILNGRSWAHVA